MLTHRPAADRGHFDHGWLNTFHTFSFAGYRDPQHMGFGPLRVINEDRVAGGRGFGRHGHANMEILSLVLVGKLAHEDSMGHGETLSRGDVQFMSAGRGIEHSEFNGDADQTVHFYQVWIEPSETATEPRYGQVHVDLEAGGTQPIAGDGSAIPLHQDAAVSFVRVDDGQSATPDQSRPRQWVQVVEGTGRVAAGDQSVEVQPGDGVGLLGESGLTLTGGDGGLSVLLFDLPE